MPSKLLIRLFTALCAILLTLTLASCGSDSPGRAAEVDAAPVEIERETLAVGPAPDAYDLYINRVADQVAIHWDDMLEGDYNVDGSVTGLDLFPLAANFNRQADEEPGLECVDGNSDNTLNGLDLFIISVHFQERIDSYGIFQDEEESGMFNEPVTTLDPMPYEGCGTYAVGAWDWEAGMGSWYALKAYDADADQWSANGAPVKVPLPPVEIWPSTTGLSPMVHLDWDGTGGPEETWVVYRCDTADGEFLQQTFEPVTTSGWDDETTQAGETWFYAVSTVDGDGVESLNSPVAEIVIPGWEILRLEETGQVGEHCEAVMTSTDVMWISYYNDSNNAVMVGSFDDGVWQTQQIDTGNGLTGEYTSIALDASENPHVSYYYQSDTLRVADFDGTDWNIADADPVEGGCFTDIAFNGQDNPGVSHHDWGDSLRYAWFDGTDWHAEEILGDGAGHGTALIYDLSDHPVIAFYHESKLQVAWHTGSEWWISVVDESSAIIGVEPEMILGNSMQPVISYSDNTNEDLKLARFNGSDWEIETIDGDSRSGMDSSMTHDIYGNLYISYRCISPLKLAWEDQGEWNIQALPTTDSGIDSAVVLTSQRLPLIAYWTGTINGNDLMLAWFH